MSDTQQGLRPAEQTNPICYYAVYHIKYDGALLYQDLLCELREAFFSTGRRLKNKVVREVGGVPYRYSYVLEQGYPLKWKKMEGVKLLEKSSPNEDGSYQVVTQNGDKRVTKIACYSPNHLWLRTEYYDAGYLRTPALVLAPLPDGRGMQLFRYENGSPAAPVFLAPCVLPAEEEARNAVNVAVGTPEIMARTHFVASRTYEHLPLYITAGLIYFLITTAGLTLLRRLERKVRIPGYALIGM